jgi:hypothetical protein
MLIDTCRTGDLLILHENTIVRYVSHHSTITGLLVHVQQSPCTCITCTVNTTIYGEHTVELEKLAFPFYNYIHYWDDNAAITRLFKRRSGRPCSELI